jgi:hypothetical protein
MSATANGKAPASGKSLLGSVKPARHLAIAADGLPTNKASSSSSATDATSGDGVAEMMGKLRLTSQESEAFILDDEGNDDLGCPEWAIVGKVLVPNSYHISTIQAALRAAWGNPKGLEMRPMGRNSFMAAFANEDDKRRVTDGSPWTVGTHAVLLTDFIPSLKPSEYTFEKLDVWVRILNLPFTMMNDRRGKALAGRIGKVGKMDVDDNGQAWGDFLRFRATINITEPLMRCVSVFS